MAKGFRFGESNNQLDTFQFGRTKPAKEDEGFRFDRPSQARPETPPILRPKFQTEEVTLTRQINGKRASDLEEYFANALRAAGITFYFQYLVDTEYSVPGEPKNVDFLVLYNGHEYPIEIYGAYFHTSAGDRLKDQNRERQLDDEFQKRGFEKLQILWEGEVFDQEAANAAVRRLFLI